jgi:hypothetical protein
MKDSTENLSWCKPYQSKDEKSWLIELEGKPISIILNGEEIETATDADIKALAQTVNESYADYSGWSDSHIALDAMQERACHECPFFDRCDAMDEEADV